MTDDITVNQHIVTTTLIPAQGLKRVDHLRHTLCRLLVTTTLIPAQGLKQAEAAIGVKNPIQGHYHTNPCTGIETLSLSMRPAPRTRVTTTLIPAQGLKPLPNTMKSYYVNLVTTTLIPAQGLKLLVRADERVEPADESLPH